MTNEELSRRVAELYGIEVYYITGYNAFSQEEETWLHDDSARCFELMVEHEIKIDYWHQGLSASCRDGVNGFVKIVIDPYRIDKALATRVVILKCLLKMKE